MKMAEMRPVLFITYAREDEDSPVLNVASDLDEARRDSRYGFIYRFERLPDGTYGNSQFIEARRDQMSDTRTFDRQVNDWARTFNAMAEAHGFDLPMPLLVQLMGLFAEARAEGARTAQQWQDELLAALKAVAQTDDDCPVCDRGRLRNPEKTHWPECPFGRAQAVITRAPLPEPPQ